MVSIINCSNLISVREKLNQSVETGVGDLLDGGSAAADGLDGGGHARLVVARDVRVELAKHDAARQHILLSTFIANYIELVLP